MRMSTLLQILFLTALLQGCTVAYYDIANPLRSNTQPIAISSKTVSYAIDLELVASNEKKTIPRAYATQQLDVLKSEYAQSTQEVLKQFGFEAQQVTHRNQADLSIRILINPYFHTLPQEYLTGLSFGLIPTSGVREQQFLFTFDYPSSRSYSYIINEKSYNHLLLTAALPASLIGLDKQRIYQKALSNFFKPEN